MREDGERTFERRSVAVWIVTFGTAWSARSLKLCNPRHLDIGCGTDLVCRYDGDQEKQVVRGRKELY